MSIMLGIFEIHILSICV